MIFLCSIYMTNNNLPGDFLINEMIMKQLKDIDKNYKLSYNDIQKISKNLNVSIFNTDQCSIWTGYITNENKQNKGMYINFYFNEKKTPLHRLLFFNFSSNIDNTEYIKFTCANKGKCCNINHMIKKKYKIKNTNTDKTNVTNTNIINRIIDNNTNTDKTNITNDNNIDNLNVGTNTNTNANINNNINANNIKITNLNKNINPKKITVSL